MTIRRIFLISCDALRWDAMSCVEDKQYWQEHGLVDQLRTPTLDTLAARGVRCRQAVTPAPYTSSAHASLLTGLLPARHGCRGSFCQAMREVPTLPRALKAHGFKSVLSSDVLFFFDLLKIGRDFDHAYCHDDLGLLERLMASRDERLFALIHFMDTNNPYGYSDARSMEDENTQYFRVLRGLVDRFMDGQEVPNDRPDKYHTWCAVKRKMISLGHRDEIVRLYLDGVVRFDQGRLRWFLQTLKEINLLEDSLLIVFGDHGEGDYEDDFSHSLGLIEDVIRIPLLLIAPGHLPAGVTIDRPVSLVDIVPTVLDILGLPVTEDAWTHGLDGESLVPFLNDAPITPRATVTEVWRHAGFFIQFMERCKAKGILEEPDYPCFLWQRAVRTSQAKYILLGESIPSGSCAEPASRSIRDLPEAVEELHGEMLFDLTTDSHDRHDLVPILGAQIPLDIVAPCRETLRESGEVRDQSRSGQPRLSALLLVRNEIDLIDAYLDNTLPHVDELVIIEGGSSDGTLERIQARRDPKIRLDVWPQDSPAYTAGWREPDRRNRALELATGTYVLKKDVDEFFLEEHYGRIREWMHADENVLHVFPRLNFWGGPGQVRVDTAEDPHWWPDPQGNLWAKRLGLHYGPEPLHCRLVPAAGELPPARVHEDVPIFHYHWAVGKRVKVNDLRWRDLVADPGQIPSALAGKAPQVEDVDFARPHVMVQAYQGAHPEAVRPLFHTRLSLGFKAQVDALAAYLHLEGDAVEAALTSSSAPAEWTEDVLGMLDEIREWRAGTREAELETLLAICEQPGGPRRVLIYACGIGEEAMQLARHGMVVTAMDEPLGSLRFARFRAECAGVPVAFLSDTGTYPAPETYDVVIALPRSHGGREAAGIREIQKCVLAGGLFVVRGSQSQAPLPEGWLDEGSQGPWRMWRRQSAGDASETATVAEPSRETVAAIPLANTDNSRLPVGARTLPLAPGETGLPTIPDDVARAITDQAGRALRPGLSCHLLVRNEVELIDLYLDNTLPYVDELIIIDGGSTDGTVERIRARASENVRLFVWSQDGASFSASWREPDRRNAAIALTRYTWILKKDADECFQESDYARIRDRMQRSTDRIICFPRLNFWGDVDHIRLDTPEDAHWSPDYQGNLWTTSLGLRWSDVPLHCQLEKDGEVYSATEICHEVPIHHYHWALGKRVKPNDLRRGDLVTDRACLPAEREDRIVDQEYVQWNRAGIRVQRYWGGHPKAVERVLGRDVETRHRRNIDNLAECLGRPSAEVAVRYWDSVGNLTREWKSRNPRTDAEVKAFYRETEGYIYNLNYWHALPDRQEWPRFIGRLCDAHGVRTLLDYGCGVADDAMALSAAGFQVEAVDLEGPTLQFARWNAARSGSGVAIRAIQSEEEIQGTYDAVVCLDVVGHLTHPIEFLKHMMGRVATGGLFLISNDCDDMQGEHPMHLPQNNARFSAVWSVFESDGCWSEIERLGPLVAYRRDRADDCLSAERVAALIATGHRLLGANEPERARVCLEHALLLDGTAVPALLALGLLRLQRGETHAAVMVFEKAVATAPEVGNWNALGCAYYRDGQPERARQAFENGLQCDPDHRETLLNLVYSYRSEGDVHNVIRLCREALRRGGVDDELSLLLREALAAGEGEAACPSGGCTESTDRWARKV